MIDLAKCDDFRLGAVTIRPSSREVIGSGGTHMVEPKVMQMLVVLARASGAVVSRENLIAQCWGSRVVGEDAINRVIGKLRRAALTDANGAFRVETVARVGLRLLPESGATAAESMPRAQKTAVRPLSRPWATAAMLGIGLAAIGGVMVGRPRASKISTPAISGLPAAVTDIETRGLSAMFEDTPEQTAEGVGYLRQATMLAPHAAPVWGSLAMSYVLNLGWVPPAERAAVVARVNDATAHAFAIDSRENRSAAAMVSLEPTFRQWDAKARALQDWTRRAYPDNGPLLYQQVQFLVAVGRTRAALVAVERLAKASPLVPWIQATRIDLLATAGRLEEADHAAANALAIWPRDRLIWFTAFDLAALNGQPDKALAMAADRADRPKATSVDEMDLPFRPSAR